MKPKISIIVPVYNVDKYISRCIDSILAQELKDIEVILVDDGSTDNSGIICDEYSKKDNRMIVIHKENGGVSSARNVGIDIARGEYIGFVDADDYIDKDMYKILYTKAIEYNSDISMCSFYYVKDKKSSADDTSDKIECFNKDEAILRYFDMISPFSGSFLWNKIFKAILFKEIRLNCNIKVEEDTEIMIKLLNNSTLIVYVGKALYYYELRVNSATYNKLSKGKITTEEAFLEIYNYTKEKIPEYKSKALIKYVRYFFNVIIEIIKNYNEYENEYYTLINKLKNRYVEIIKDKNIPIKYKAHSAFVIAWPKLYRRYIQFKCKL